MPKQIKQYIRDSVENYDRSVLRHDVVNKDLKSKPIESVTRHDCPFYSFGAVTDKFKLCPVQSKKDTEAVPFIGLLNNTERTKLKMPFYQK